MYFGGFHQVHKMTVLLSSLNLLSQLFEMYVMEFPAWKLMQFPTTLISNNRVVLDNILTQIRALSSWVKGFNNLKNLTFQHAGMIGLEFWNLNFWLEINFKIITRNLSVSFYITKPWKERAPSKSIDYSIWTRLYSVEWFIRDEYSKVSISCPVLSKDLL